MVDPYYRPVTIFLVEDDDVDAKGIKRSLDRLRIANPLVRAKDGIEALEMLESQQVSSPFLILLDLNMPRMGGLELLERLRKDDNWSDTVIFVLTTSKDEDDVASAYSQHIAGYIVKERLEQGFDDLVKLLDHYWRIVELP